MSIIELGALGEFLGSIAVVVTLIYLAIQVRQNTAIAESTAMQAFWSSSSSGRFELINNRDLAELVPAMTIDPKLLTEENWVRVGLFIEKMFRQYQMTFLLHKRGVIDHDIFNVEMQTCAGFLKFPGLKQWWDVAGVHILVSEFIHYIENLETKEGATFGWSKDAGWISGDQWLESETSNE